MSDRAQTAGGAMGAPSKKRKRSIALASDVQSAASSLNRASAVRQMTTAYLEEFCEDPWSYTQKQVGIIDTCSQEDLDGVADSMWAQTSWQITAGRVMGPGGMVKLNKRCAVTHTEEGELESAHLVPARGEDYFDGTFYRGQLDIEIMKKVQVVPEYAHVNAQANRIEFSGPVHSDFDKQLLDVLPNQDQVVSRVLCKIKYQGERAAASTSGVQGKNVVKPPAQPPFKKFYAAAEKTACFRLITSNLRPSPNIVRYVNPDHPTTFALEGIAEDDPFRLLWPDMKKPSSDKPLLPSIIAPLSFNLLIWALRNRVRRKLPSSKSLIEETSVLDDFIALLLAFWFLTDDAPATDVAALLERSKTLVRDQGGPAWAQRLENLAATEYNDVLNAVSFPADALRAQDPRPAPQEQALMLAAAAAYNDASSSCEHLTALDLEFTDSVDPCHLDASPYAPLTAAALETLDSDQLTAASPPSPSALSSLDAKQKASTPPLSHAASSCASTSGMSLSPHVVETLIAHDTEPAKLPILASWLANGPYPSVETNTPHSV